MSHNYVVVSQNKSVSRNLGAYGIVYRVLDSEFGGGAIQVSIGPMGVAHKFLGREYSKSGFEAFQDSFRVLLAAVSQTDSWLTSISCPGENDSLYARDYDAVSVSVFVFLPETLPESLAATRALANG